MKEREREVLQESSLIEAFVLFYLFPNVILNLTFVTLSGNKFFCFNSGEIQKASKTLLSIFVPLTIILEGALSFVRRRSRLLELWNSFFV
jgi:positive regulator of sigma E activity